MANYPQLDNASGVWNLREVYDAVMGGYWPNYNSIALVTGVDQNAGASVDKVTIATTGDATVFGDSNASEKKPTAKNMFENSMLLRLNK